jgi:hypothetical protein
MKGVDPSPLFIALGKKLKAEEWAASELWGWLPSYHVTRMHHPDVTNLRHHWQPPTVEVMREAFLFLGVLWGNDITRHKLTTWFGCRCGDPNHQTADGILKLLREQWERPFDDITLKNTGGGGGRGDD